MAKRPFKFYLGIAVALFLIASSIFIIVKAYSENVTIEISVSTMFLYIASYTGALFIADLLRWCFKKPSKKVHDTSRL